MGYFDLQIPAHNSLEEDIDLTGLKWDKIAEDLYEFTGLTFDNTKVDVKYAWKGDSKLVISENNNELSILMKNVKEHSIFKGCFSFSIKFHNTIHIT